MKITHEQKLQALKDSVEIYKRVVKHYCEAPTGGKARPLQSVRGNCGGVPCPLCQIKRRGCSNCPLESCEAGSLFAAIENATTNPEAYEASKAMLARLEELLEEEEARKPEVDIRVGDVVCYEGAVVKARTPFTFGTEKSHADIKLMGIVTALGHARYDGQITIARFDGGQQYAPAESYILIHRPTKGK